MNRPGRLLGSLVLSVLLTLAMRSAGSAQAPLRSDPEKLLGFAHALLSEGDAYRAISEYKAFVLLFPRHARNTEAWFSLGKAYVIDRRWQEALGAFGRAAQGGPEEDPWAARAALEAGETLLKAGHPASAARALENVARSPRWTAVREEALFKAAWAWAKARRWDDAVRALQEIPPGHPLHDASQGVREEIAEGVPALPRRSPWLAGGMAALLPGTGHLYVGRPKDALTSFLLNGAFIAGAVVAIREGYLVTGGILSFFEMGWYLGGITTASQGARRFNRDQEADLLLKIGDRWGLALGVDPQGGDHFLAWTMRF